MDFTKLSSYLDTLGAADIPVFDVEVRKGHEVVFRKGIGNPDAERKAPLTGNELYRIYSCSKVSLCLGALKLVEEGKIALDDPVSKYIPEYAELTVKDGDTVRPAKTTMLVGHLFLMEGGWDYGAFTQFPDPMSVKDNITLSKQMAKVPLHFDPGTRYEYGLSQDVLGGIIEVVTGMSLGEWLDKIMFAPLGMTDTGFHPNEEQKTRLVPAYNYDNERNVATLIPPRDGLDIFTTLELGSGGLVSSVRDYSILMDMIAHEGTGWNGAVCFKPETIRMCKKNLLEGEALVDFRKWQTVLYGYGWGLCGRVHMNKDISGSRSPEGEFGWNGATATYAMADTENKVSIYIGMQIFNGNYAYNVIHHKVRDLAYEAMGL